MKIAIQGHPTRGKEVIQILESLGGQNIHAYWGHSGNSIYYYINKHCKIVYDSIHVLSLYDYKLYTLEEFEKEFPFKIGDKVVCKATQQILHTIVGISWDSFACIQYEIKEDKTGIITHCPTNLLIKYTEMKEERNITLTLDKAKEWYKKGRELKEIALQAFSEQELNPLPRSWEAYCRKYKSVCLSTRYTNIPLKYDALIKLEQLRNCWWNGWEPEWSDCEKHVIKWEKDDLIIFTARRVHAFLVFPTKEMAYVFLKCFRDLIEKAGDLI